jgi:CheY-like chemotaxis protein
MIIDDNTDVADSTADLLRNAGHTIFVEYSGASAMARAAQESVQVFLVDIGLPDTDGYALLKQLKALPTSEKSIFVAVTGYGQPKDRELTAAAGFTHHLVKPAKSKVLKALLAELQPMLAAKG